MLSDRIIDLLISGDIDFLDIFSKDQLEVIVDQIRNSPYRDNILYGSFKDIAKKYPVYAFKTTFDMPQYTAYWIKTLKADHTILLGCKFLLYFLLSVDWAVDLVLEILPYLVLENKNTLFAIIRHAKKTGNYKIINTLKNHPNMEIRALFMIEVIDSFPYMFKTIYEDIIKYLVKYNNKGEETEVMKENYVSKIASLLLLHLNDEESYLKVREFILQRYDSNTLAAELDRYGKLIESVDKLNKYYLICDIDTLFRTSKNYKYALFKRYGEYLSKDIYEDFKKQIQPFMEIDDEIMASIFINGLGEKFFKYVNKYLALSTGAKVIGNVGRGSCTRTFRVGDYVIKCSDKKWSLEENICPSCYLILRNLEEDMVRGRNGEVTGALEVQKYLSRPLLAAERQSIANFHNAFQENGYYLKDRLLNEEYGPNCRYLDDYHDADCEDPELLPDWFKKDPVVLVDRDLVFSLNNKNPKIKAVNI